MDTNQLIGMRVMNVATHATGTIMYIKENIIAIDFYGEIVKYSYDEVYGQDVEAEAEEETADSLHSLREQLLQRISKLQEEINAIKCDFPYTEKEFLDNPQAVKAKQDAIVHLIEEYEKEITRLNEVLLEVNRKMDELKKKKRRNKHE